MSEVYRRWEEGVPHDIRSERLARAIAEIDAENGEYFGFKFGGDGDSGEDLLYILDIYFARGS